MHSLTIKGHSRKEFIALTSTGSRRDTRLSFIFNPHDKSEDRPMSFPTQQSSSSTPQFEEPPYRAAKNQLFASHKTFSFFCWYFSSFLSFHLGRPIYYLTRNFQEEDQLTTIMRAHKTKQKNRRTRFTIESGTMKTNEVRCFVIKSAAQRQPQEACMNRKQKKRGIHPRRWRRVHCVEL
jgi:hypothetical protein